MKKYFIAWFLGALVLNAATFNVSTTPELRTALSTAATNGEDDTIILADGTYKTTDDGQGTFIYLSNEANSLTLKGSSADKAILSGNYLTQILNHKSTQNASLILEKLSFVDGNNTSGDGGGVYTDYSIFITDCNFTNNRASGSGGGFETATSATVTNSTFTNNSAYTGGGFYTHSSATVTNSTFTNNSARNEGGGFSASYSAKVTVTNSTFTNNSAGNGGGFSASYFAKVTVVTNSIFAKNSNGMHVSSQNNKIYNNIFKDNNISDISGNSTTIISNLENNYLDISRLTVSNFAKNNIFDGITLGFVDEANGNYQLTQTSDLIDKGLSSISGITLPITDMLGNQRISGASIDIGPYEFSSTKPTIHSFTCPSEAKILTPLTFYAIYDLADGRSDGSVVYDYENNGTWVSTNTHTYSQTGTYTVKVKITDNTGEFSTSSLTLTVADLPFNEMTDAQKLQKAIDPQYYDQIMTIIASNSQIVSNIEYDKGYTAGKTYVQTNPTEFNLVTKDTLTQSIADANASGYTLGIDFAKTQCALNPSSCGIASASIDTITTSYVASLPTSWTLIGTANAVSDMTIFNNAKIVWIYTNGSWLAYSSVSQTQQSLENANIDTITTVPSNSGIWILK